MPHTIVSRNRALAVIDAECERHHMPSYTDVAHVLQQLAPLLDRCLGEPCLGIHHNDATDAVLAAERILKQIKGE